MQQHSTQYRISEQSERRTLRWLTCLLIVALLILAYGVIKLNSDAAILGFILSATLILICWLHYSGRADEAAIMGALNKRNGLTYSQIVLLVSNEVNVGDIFPALSRLERKGLIIRRADPYLGDLWEKVDVLQVPV